MSSSPKSDLDAERFKIAAVRDAWIEAVDDDDVSRLADTATNDFVGVLPDGGCVTGKDGLKKNFLRAFAAVDVRYKVTSSEVVVRGKWAFEIIELETTRTSVKLLTPTPENSKVVIVFARQPDDSWRVSRLMKLSD